MKKNEMISALKNAMRGELDSINVYQNALSNTTNNEVQNFFRNMIEEEQRHYNYLLEYYKSISKEEDLQELDIKETTNYIFSDSFKQQIGSNQILFSAISVATLLEKNAFKFYQTAAKQTDDRILKEFFEKMANWEKQHYDDLIEIAEEAEITYWQQNRFEPF
jgi:rubrerythrin